MKESLLIGGDEFIDKVFAPETLDQIRRNSRLREPVLNASNVDSHGDTLADV